MMTFYIEKDRCLPPHFIGLINQIGLNVITAYSSVINKPNELKFYRMTF